MSQLEKCDRRSLFARSAPSPRLPASLPKAATFRALTSRRSPSAPVLRVERSIRTTAISPDFISQIEDGLLAEIRERVELITAAQLPDLYRNIDELEPAPGSVELLRYLAANRDLIGALLGPGGDPPLLKRSSIPHARPWCRVHRQASWAGTGHLL